MFQFNNRSNIQLTFKKINYIGNSLYLRPYDSPVRLFSSLEMCGPLQRKKKKQEYIMKQTSLALLSDPCAKLPLGKLPFLFNKTGFT